MTTKQERLKHIERQIERLRGRIAGMERQSHRYGWIRVFVFFGGLLISVGGFVVAWWLAAILLFVTLVSFGIIAYYHSKLERSISNHTALLYIMRTHIARMQLNWPIIPAVQTSGPRSEHPFEIDLDITGEHSLHRLLNTASSHEGSQRLCDWLLSPSPDPTAIEYRQTLVRELTPLTRFRDTLMLKSLIVGSRSSEHLEGARLLHWLAKQESPVPMQRVLMLSIALHLLTLVLFLSTVFLGIGQFWIYSLIGSIFLLFATNKWRGDLFEDTSYLRYAFSMLSGVFSYLEQYPYGKHEHLKKLCEPFFADRENGPSKLLKKTARIASAATLKRNGLLWLILNALIPWDDYCAFRLRQYQQKIARTLPTWLDAWFELEALTSLATFAYLNPEYTLPVVAGEENQSNKGIFRGVALGHPLIPVEKKVTNDFALDSLGEVIIITGSNMSGKSTFLRTLGVNLALAYAGGPVNAEHLQTQLFRLFTCIRVSDSVTEGYSYFYAEVRRLRMLLTALDQPGYPLFFLIDEIFKGTNNRERLIGSRSFVHALVGKHCVGGISTHDLELVTLADTLPDVQNYHFREEVVNGEMTFDYHLRPGPCPTTNALKIMRMEGLPVEEV